MRGGSTPSCASDCQSADNADANLSRVSPRGADLAYADLSGAKLVGMSSVWAYLGNVNFTNAIMKSADLSNADPGKATLSGAI